MHSAVYVTASFIRLSMDVLILLFFIRAVLSVFKPDEDSSVQIFLHNVTEFFVFSVRRLTERFEITSALPFDAAFFITQTILIIFRSFLPSITY